MQEKAREQGAAYIPMPKGRGFTPHFDNYIARRYIMQSYFTACFLHTRCRTSASILLWLLQPADVCFLFLWMIAETGFDLHP